MGESMETVSEIGDILRGFVDTIAAEDPAIVRLKEDRAEKQAAITREAAFVNDFKIPHGWVLERFTPEAWPEGHRIADAAIRDVWASVENGKNFRAVVNVVFAGESGAGKSWLSCAIGRHAAAAGYKVFRLNEIDLRMFWNMGGRFRADSPFADAIERAKGCDILIFEEFAKHELTEDEHGEQLTEFGDAVYSIYNFRYETGRPTITTTQIVEMKDLNNAAGHSLMRRVVNFQRHTGRSSCRIAYALPKQEGGYFLG